MTTQDPLAALLHDAMMSDEGKTMEGVAAYLRAHGVTLAATPPAIDPERLARALRVCSIGCEGHVHSARHLTSDHREDAAAIIAAYEADGQS